MRMPLARRPSAVICLLVILGFGALLQSAPPQGAAGAAQGPPAAGPRIPPGLQDRAARGGRVRVIVHLKLATGPHAPEGNLPAPALRAQRSAIAGAAARVLSRLPAGSYTVLRRFTTVGFMVLDVTPAGLDA